MAWNKNALELYTRAWNSKYFFKFSIIIPEANAKDLDDIPADLKKSVIFYPVKTIREVLCIAFPTVMEKIAPKLWWLILNKL